MPNTTTTGDIPLLTTPFLHYIPTSPPSQELDFHLPSRTPLHGLTVSEWAGSKTRLDSLTTNNISPSITITTTNNTTVPITCSNLSSTKPIVLLDATEDNWKDVYRNIKCMDQLYDASFYSWLKSEENVLVTAMYLHRIANEYPLLRIINALKWLISDWRLESISTLVRHVTVDWCDEAGDLRRAHLLRHLTQSWATQYTTTLITMVLSSAPYTTGDSFQRERFLRAFTKEWDFSKLSEFFMYLQSPANIDYKVKCVMLQEAARRERETLGAKLLRKKRVVVMDELEEQVESQDPHHHESDDVVVQMEESAAAGAAAAAAGACTNRRHHRRTSSNDVNDIKRLRLSTPDPDEDHPHSLKYLNELSHLHLSNVDASGSSSSSGGSSSSSSSSSCAAGSSSSSSSSTVVIGSRTRSASIESCDDPMETDSTVNKKRAITAHFTEE
ncbi:hypothetical protein INT47_002281 [Mucor saturninus]|uniref:Uncharacterized protein n=1 Tax=Mucor saturninus TaxID=64648 RepID=A0A8H7QXX4_9FUNG|nr:hypothetical protein INT47_002281 [Mucor saturninus]